MVELLVQELEQEIHQEAHAKAERNKKSGLDEHIGDRLTSDGKSAVVLAALDTDNDCKHDNSYNVVDYRRADYRGSDAAFQMSKLAERLNCYRHRRSSHDRTYEQRLIKDVSAHCSVRIDAAIDIVHQESSAKGDKNASQRYAQRDWSGFKQVAEVRFKPGGEHQDNYSYLSKGLDEAVCGDKAKHGLTDDKSGKYLTDHLGSLALLRKKSHQLCGYQDYRQILKAIYHNMISFLSLISDFTP